MLTRPLKTWDKEPKNIPKKGTGAPQANNEGAFGAGGASKYVCLYDVAEKVMLRRFQISANRSLDGVLDQLNSKNITDAGPLDLIQDSASDDDDVLFTKEGQWWSDHQDAIDAWNEGLNPYLERDVVLELRLCFQSKIGKILLILTTSNALESQRFHQSS